METKPADGGRFTRPLDEKGPQRLTWPPGGRQHNLPLLLFLRAFVSPQPTNNLFPELFPPNKKLPSTQKEKEIGQEMASGTLLQRWQTPISRKNKTQKPRRINRRPVTFLALQKRINKSPLHTKSYTKIIHSGDGG